MKITAPLFSLLLLVPLVRAEPAPAPSVDAMLFPPEFIMQFKDEIKLTDKQADSIISVAQKMMPELEELEKNVRAASRELAVLLAETPVKTEAALAQFDKVLDRERELKRAHLKLILAIREQLAKEQIDKLVQFKKEREASVAEAEKMEKAIQEKARRIEDGAKRWQSEGRDPAPIVELMRKVEPLLREGKGREAHAVLDQAIKLLDGAK
jgi:Spy/CpxP family protein refolding chaperone